MRLSIRAMKYFLAATEHASIARAASEMNVAPSAISSAIDQVEAEFGLSLVNRFPAKGIKSTFAGRQIERRIRHLLEEYDNLLSEGAELKSGLNGEVSVGYYAPVAPAFMPRIAGSLVRENPGIKVSLSECDNEQAQAGLLDGSFDLALFVAADVRLGIEYRTLLEAPPFLLVGNDHPLASQSSVRFDQLSGARLVLLDLPFTSAYYRSLIDTHLTEALVVAKASSGEMVRSLVAEGVGCAILNMRPSIERTYCGKAVSAIPIENGSPALKLAIGYSGGPQRRLVGKFLETTLNFFRSEAAEKLVVRMTNAV